MECMFNHGDNSKPHTVGHEPRQSWLSFHMAGITYRNASCLDPNVKGGAPDSVLGIVEVETLFSTISTNWNGEPVRKET